MNNRAEYRGKTADELNATMPVFESWEQAVASPFFAQMDDRYKTMWLQELYGLGQDRAVRDGRIVNDNHSLRNGILGGIAMLGGMSALGAALPSGAGATAGTLGGISTGAAAPGATGAVVGTAAGVGMPAHIVGTGINAAAQVYGANRANAASNRAADASERGNAAELAFLREQEAERRRQWDADQQQQARQWAASEEERAYNRTQSEANAAERTRRAALEERMNASTEDERLYRRRLDEERDARRQPYRDASLGALGRLGSLMGGGQGQWRSPSNVGRPGTLGAVAGR